MPVHTAEIVGDVGVGGVTVQVLRAATGEVEEVTESISDGSYVVTLLPAGTYRVLPAKSGFVFNPAERTVAIGVGGQQTADFTAEENTGILTVNTTSDGVTLSGVTVSAVSKDNTVVRSKVSGSSGQVVFEDLNGGKTYTVQATRTGYAANPTSLDVILPVGSSKTADFDLVLSTSVLAGTVLKPNGVTVHDANIAARRLSTGNVFRATTKQGAYEIDGLPGGTYQVVASLSGFVSDTLEVTLSDGQTQAGQDFTLTPLNVRVVGHVMFAGQGVAGVTVEATAASRHTTTTKDDGRFVFAALPVSATADDTTTYQLRISGEGIDPKTRILDLRGNQAGRSVTVEDFLLPSGQLQLTFTNGLEPLAGVTITLDKPSGESTTSTTSAQGLFTSVNTLAQGTYRLTATKGGYLRPSATVLQFELASDTAKVVQTIPLPYQHTVPTQVAAGRDAEMTIRFPRGLSPGASTSARLFYKRASQQQYAEVTMARQDTLFAGTLPAQFALEDLDYYLQVDDALRGITYTTPTNTITPTAEGILTTVRLNPALGGLNLRAGETYTLHLTLRDGIGDSMEDEFMGGAGRLTWTTSDPALTIAYPEPGDSTTITLSSTSTGSYTLTATARLDGASATTKANVNVGDQTIGEVAVTAPVTRVSNQSAGIQLSYSVADTSGTPVLLGNSLDWGVSPAEVASVSDQGFLVPTDPAYIGPLQVTVTDAVSGLSSTTKVAVFARVDGTQAYTLNDARGMELTLPQGAVPFTAEVGLADARLVTPKKYVRSGTDQRSYTVGDQIVRFTFRSDRALPGDSLATDASLALLMDGSLRFHEGNKAIARFDKGEIQWQLLASNVAGDQMTTSIFRKFGEYAVMAENEALGLRHMSVLPNPFSPDVAPLKIGYVLATQAPPAEVTIEVFNLRGELVRTLIDGALQQPGRFGSRTSPLEITWDGLVDSGALARNGRYLIRITARDGSGEVNELIPVVLIK